jgi:hypothetical protein
MRHRTGAIGVAVGVVVLAVGLLPIFLPSVPCGTMEGPLPPSCQPSPYFVTVFSTALPLVGMAVIAVSLAELALSYRKPTPPQRVRWTRGGVWQVLGGLLASAGIFLVMFVVILGPLLGEVQSINSTPLWVGVVYVPYLVIGAASLARNQRAFGLTLILVGLITAFFFGGFVYGVSGSF